jgi:hypothetical protein
MTKYSAKHGQGPTTRKSKDEDENHTITQKEEEVPEEDKAV